MGIAEEHAVTFAGGLAKGGLHPFVAIYSTFLQRAYDEILHDVALQSLPVTFLIDRAGFVGADGKTHQGLFDLSYLSQIPNMKVWTPSTYSELSQMMSASLSQSCPVAIRYSKTLSEDSREFTGSWNIIRQAEERRIVLLAVGSKMTEAAQAAVENIDGVEVVDVTTVKPLDGHYLDSIGNGVGVITLEENVLSGGFGQSVTAYFADKTAVTVKNMGVDDVFVAHATVDEQIRANGLDAESVKAVVNDMLKNR